MKGARGEKKKDRNGDGGHRFYLRSGGGAPSTELGRKQESMVEELVYPPPPPSSSLSLSFLLSLSSSPLFPVQADPAAVRAPSAPTSSETLASATCRLVTFSETRSSLAQNEASASTPSWRREISCLW